MNRQSPRRSILHTLLSTLTRKVPEQTKQHAQASQRPAPSDHDAWRAYWKEQGQPWRTEPEIDEGRQKELNKRRAIVPDIEKGIYSFEGMALSRADVEWLLATHENGRGPVNWSDENQQKRWGIDLRGADLRGVNLSSLPLTRLRGGPAWGPEVRDTDEDRKKRAGILLEGANLSRAHLEGAELSYARLKGANLTIASAEEVKFLRAKLDGANLSSGDFTWAHFIETHLEDAQLAGTGLQKAVFLKALLKGAVFYQARLQNAHFTSSDLRGTDFDGANLREASFTNVTLSNDKHIGPRFADVIWNDADLTRVGWSEVTMLGNEYGARQKKRDGQVKDRHTRQAEYDAAIRANRQLANALQGQGLNRNAAYFAYRAQSLEKSSLWLQIFQHGEKIRYRMRALGGWFFSWFLFLLAGYGYKPMRSFLTYLLVISFFMSLYHILDSHLAWGEAFVVSMTAFHGRGFSPSTFSPGDPLSIASAVEAFVGLIIEVTFIATLTRRFFGQ